MSGCAGADGVTRAEYEDAPAEAAVSGGEGLVRAGGCLVRIHSGPKCMVVVVILSESGEAGGGEARVCVRGWCALRAMREKSSCCRTRVKQFHTGAQHSSLARFRRENRQKYSQFRITLVCNTLSRSAHTNYISLMLPHSPIDSSIQVHYIHETRHLLGGTPAAESVWAGQSAHASTYPGVSWP